MRDGTTVQSLRLEMMNGQYLLIDGMRVRVVLTEGIQKISQGNGLFSSDIYIIPTTWNGTRLTYLEYMPMENAWQDEYANAFGLKTISSINNGQFIVGNRHNGLCLEWLLGMKMRLIMRTPFLAARLDDVQYTSLVRTKTADQGDSFNYTNGGISRRTF